MDAPCKGVSEAPTAGEGATFLCVEEKAPGEEADPPMDREVVESEGDSAGGGTLRGMGLGEILTLGGAATGAGAGERWKNEGIRNDGIRNPPPELWLPPLERKLEEERPPPPKERPPPPKLPPRPQAVAERRIAIRPIRAKLVNR